MFDRCGVVLDGGATLPGALGRGAYRALGLRGVLILRRVVLSGRWFRGGRARPSALAACHGLRPRNYLFAGSDAGGERAAAIYSLIGTAKLLPWVLADALKTNLPLAA
jgi:hypothetical protein